MSTTVIEHPKVRDLEPLAWPEGWEWPSWFRIHRILATGDRDWDDEPLVERVFHQFKVGPGTTVIHGAARGLDLIADAVAKRLGAERLPFKALWTEQGKAAGPLRNTKMLKEGQPEVVLAFHPDLRESKGTRNMLLQANVARLMWFLYPEERPEGEREFLEAEGLLRGGFKETYPFNQPGEVE